MHDQILVGCITSPYERTRCALRKPRTRLYMRENISTLERAACAPHILQLATLSRTVFRLDR